MKKILVADDDPAILESVKMMLELEGYDVLTTTDGKTVYKVEDEVPDLLLLDIWMAGYDGRDICKYIKKNPSTRDIPVIMISASRDVKHSAVESGADDFIAKPFEMDVLLEAVAEQLQN